MTTTAPPLLLEAEQLAKLIGSTEPGLLILDTCCADNYQRHHIPGAIHIEPSALQCGIPPAPGKLPGIKQLNQLFSKVGLTPEHHVIAYDDEGGGWAGRLIWTLECIGHNNYSYLNGGLHAWVNEGHPIERQGNQGKPSQFSAVINKAPIAEIEDILPRLGSDDFSIWDARSASEYNGSRIAAKHGGHIPGAINIDWLELIDRDNNMRLVNLEQLQQRLNALELTPDKQIVTHCQTHHRSGLSYLAMKILGYPDIKAYHGSWSEWGNRDDTPIVCQPACKPPRYTRPPTA